MSATTSPAVRLGDIAIHRIVESQQAMFQVKTFFPDITQDILDENREWLYPKLIEPGTDKLVLAVQSYVIETPHHKILVDSCVGNHKQRPARPFWHEQTSDRYERNLAAAGFGVGDIDFVMCTHLHVDHVGWNTRLDNGRWVPTFPNARYLFSGRELAFWTEREGKDPTTCPWITDSVLPIVAARQSETITSTHALNDHVHCIPTPGHTIDHFAVQLGKRDADAIITGDMIHTPLQARYPELGMFADYDREQGKRTRREFLSRFCDTPTLICPAHFPTPTISKIVRRGSAFEMPYA